MKQRFFIRQITQPDELREMFALRYRVFRESQETAGFAPTNSVALAMDAYDSKSIHFGLYCMDSESSRLVGSMRVCYADDHVHNEHVLSLCTGCPALQHAAAKPARELPFLEYSQLNPEGISVVPSPSPYLHAASASSFVSYTWKIFSSCEM